MITSEPRFAEPSGPEPHGVEARGVEPSNPARRDLDTTPAGRLRASDADREQVSVLLSRAYAEGRITREEHDERLDQVLTARTFDDLVPLTADLVPVEPAPTVSSPRPAYDVAPTPTQRDADTMVAVFSGVKREGRWRVRRHTQTFALFGGIDLDLRDAVFDAPVVEVSGFWCFAGLEIKVPAGIEVRDHTVGIFGGTDVRDLGEPEPGAPTLVIKGMTLFGGVTVKGPKRRRRR